MPPSKEIRVNFKRLALNRVKIVNQLRKRIKNVSKIWMQLQLNKGNQAVQMTVLIMAPSPLSILFTTVFTLIRFCESEANPQTYLMPRRFNNLNLFSDNEFNTDAKNHTSALYNQPLSYQDHYIRAGSSEDSVFGHEKRRYKQVRIHQCF